MSNKKVAIIGAGIAGLTLAYALRRSGKIDFTLFTASDAEEVRNGRILSTQIHFERLLRTEARCGMADYGPVNEIRGIDLIIGGQRLFRGNLRSRAVSQDQRLYLSSLLDALCTGSANVRKTRLTGGDLEHLADSYDLIVDCTGKKGPIASFPEYKELQHTPDAPLRLISAGMFRGISNDNPHTMEYNILPGQGELFETTTMTAMGLAGVLLLEAVPGGELDRIKGNPAPDVFVKELLNILQTHFPHIYERINVAEFRPVDPLAYMRTAIQPKVHLPYTKVGGTLVIGCGDSFVLNDPVTGQGANAASFCANALYEVLNDNADRSWNVEIGERYWERTKEYVTKVSQWTNAMMGPPSAAFSELLGKAANDQATADDIVNLFSDPVKAHDVYFSVPSERQ